jgi:hypothetical protein
MRLARAELKLLDECHVAIVEHEEERRQKFERLKLRLAASVPYRTAVVEITGEKRFDRAEAKFLKFLREQVADEVVRDESLKVWKKDGLPSRKRNEL